MGIQCKAFSNERHYTLNKDARPHGVSHNEGKRLQLGLRGAQTLATGAK